MQQISSKREWIAPACGVLGVLAAVWVYWMILPGLILGAVAVAWLAHPPQRGQRARKRRDGPGHRRDLSRALGPVHRRRCGGLGSGLCVGPDP